MSELSPCHVGSGQVMTVHGPDPGRRHGRHPAARAYPERLPLLVARADRTRARSISPTEPVHIGILGELRMDPFVNLHNCALDDEPLAIAELLAFSDAGRRHGGRSRPAAASAATRRRWQRISGRTGLNIVMGSGYYLQSSHPPELAAHVGRRRSPTEIVAEAHRRHRRRAHRPDRRDRRLLRLHGRRAESRCAEPRARRTRTRLPLMVHLPGWFRHGLEVLDMVEEEGGDPAIPCSAT